MSFGVCFGLAGKDSRCLRRGGHLLGHLGDLGLKHFGVCGYRVYLGIEFGERVVQKFSLVFELLKLEWNQALALSLKKKKKKKKKKKVDQEQIEKLQQVYH
ncbi:hypothetical protein MTR_5g048620 [Medicago truncatula]|uniref:Uncharacterized protein n=1 Tax=Medicago truncatula TaxID=3880 RepID=A0A072UPY2_MEDTR|nr:hypothetical protein MTR_5g048620 [Medicago truncatula]